jgi:hypothetical protein
MPVVRQSLYFSYHEVSVSDVKHSNEIASLVTNV